MQVPHNFRQPGHPVGRPRKAPARPWPKGAGLTQLWDIDVHANKVNTHREQVLARKRGRMVTPSQMRNRKAVARLIRRSNRRTQLLFIRRSESIMKEMYDPLVQRIAQVTIAMPIKHATPKRTGRLSRSARTTRGRRPKRKSDTKVRLAMIMSGHKKGARHAHLVEFGTRLMEPRKYFFKTVDRVEARFRARVAKLVGTKFVRRVTNSRGHLR